MKDALVQHADFRDTSKWAGRVRPTKWRQSAPKPNWWKEVLDHRADPAQLSHQPEVGLRRATIASHQQYGRKTAMNHIHEATGGTVSLQEVLFADFLERAAFLRQEDLLELLAITPKEQHDHLRDLFHKAYEQAEDFAEYMGPES